MFFEIEVSAVVSKRTVSFPSQRLHRIIRHLEGDCNYRQNELTKLFCHEEA